MNLKNILLFVAVLIISKEIQCFAQTKNEYPSVVQPSSVSIGNTDVISGDEKSIQYPFLGLVNSDNVNIRAGQSNNFESLSVLKKGDEVVVLDKLYSWYKLRLPINVPVYVSSKYVFNIDDKNGQITSDKVNTRARPNINSTILGQLNAGTHVDILNKVKDDWFEIRPAGDIAGWISDKYISLKSKHFEIKQIATYTLTKIEETKKKEIVESPKEKKEPQDLKIDTNVTPKDKEVVREDSRKQEGIVSVVGYIKSVIQAEKTVYKIDTDNQTSYYLDAPSYIINNFTNRKVVVDGIVKDSVDDNIKTLELIKIKLLI